MNLAQNLSQINFSQNEILSILSKAPPEPIKALAEQIIPALDPITVVYNRTGLVMLPYTDSAQGTPFYLGEVLIAEARVQTSGGAEGYGACLGIDIEQALALALLDAAWSAGIARDVIDPFVSAEAERQAAADHDLLRAVESTRAVMETF